MPFGILDPVAVVLVLVLVLFLGDTGVLAKSQGTYLNGPTTSLWTYWNDYRWFW
jgi:hypothetical protein